VDADQCERPGTWIGGFKDPEQGLLEYPGSHIVKRGRVRTAQSSARRPQGTAMTVIRAALFEPIALGGINSNSNGAFAVNDLVDAERWNTC
jgi:hypothetical protein